MIEKLPKITNNKDNADDSKKTGEEELSKIRGVLSGELSPTDIRNKGIDEISLPDVDSSLDTEKKDKLKKEEPSSQKGGTWHDDYDNY